MSNFKTFQSRIQGSTEVFTPFSPAGDQSKQSSSSNPNGQGGGRTQSHQESETQKLRRQLEILQQQNQLLQQQLQESQQYLQKTQIQSQEKERKMLETMQSYQDVFREIEASYKSSSQDIRENFIGLLEGILQGVFASSVIMDAALYSSLSSVLEDLQDQNVILSVHKDQLSIAESFLREVGVQHWSVHTDETLPLGGFRIDSQLSQWLQDPRESIQIILTKIESHLRT